MDYWVVHRQLANARKAAPDHAGDIEPMIASLAKLHAALFTAPPAAIRRSAEARAVAAATVDRITGGYSRRRGCRLAGNRTGPARCLSSGHAPSKTHSEGQVTNGALFVYDHLAARSAGRPHLDSDHRRGKLAGVVAWGRGRGTAPTRDQNGVGTRHRYTWKSKLPYRLIFRDGDDPSRASSSPGGRAEGELQGTGCWTFAAAEGITTVRYDWNVQTTQAWMNLLAPLARPIFAWNHDVVMTWGSEGLAKLVGAPLLSSRAD